MQNLQTKQQKEAYKEARKQILANKKDRFRLNVKVAVAILRNCYFFVIASFFNMISPIIMCIILAYIPQFGLQCILGIGRAGYFTIAFGQMSLTFSISVTALYKRFFMPYKMLDESTQDSYVLSNAILFELLVTIFSLIVYDSSAFAYLYYSTFIPNTYIAFYQGIEYIFVSDLYIFLLPIMDILLLYVLSINKNSAIYFNLIFYALLYVLVYLLADLGHLLGVGAGLALFLACLINIDFLYLYIFVNKKLKVTKKIHNFIWRIKHIKGLGYEAVPGLCINTFRGLGVLILAFTVFQQAGNDVVPMAYNTAIIFLLNYMYIIAFTGIGFADTVKYYYLYFPINNKSKRTLPFWLMIIINISFASLITYIMSIATLPLATLYSQNNAYIPPLEIPQLPNGMPSIPSNMYPPTKFPLLPSTFYDPNVTKVEQVIKYIEYSEEHPTNNPEFFAWVDWFKNIPAPLRNWIIQNPRTFAIWLQKYEFYASCPPSVVNAFINLRSANEISKPDQFALMLPQLAFNAKSMIYLGVFGIAYGSYYIFSASGSSLSGRKIPIFITIGGAFFLITFVIIFGGVFTMIFKNNANNPFQNLDAFTFPLMLIGITLMSVGFLSFSIAVIKVKKETKKVLKNNSLTELKIVQNTIIL